MTSKKFHLALSIRGYRIIKAAQATHHKGDVRYGKSSGIQWSFMSIISVTFTLFRYP